MTIHLFTIDHSPFTIHHSPLTIHDNICGLRMLHQQITGGRLKTVQELVSHMGVMQAQNYTMAKWAVGLRLPGSTEVEVENEINKGSVLRTHVLRPTWHFITQMDIRWMLKLSASGVRRQNAYWYRTNGLNKSSFRKSKDVLWKVLQGGHQLTRTELQAAFLQNKIKTKGIQLAGLLMDAELEGIICSGARKGKQFTYTLLDERVPPSATPDKEESLSKLALRYFHSHGPATVYDFSWWSGLSIRESKAAIDGLPTEFEKKLMDGHSYIFTQSQETKPSIQRSFLLPDYDEYVVSYKDRSALLSPGHEAVNLIEHHLIIDGKLGGRWSAATQGTGVKIHPSLSLNKRQEKDLLKAVEHYSHFFNLAIKKQDVQKNFRKR
ncbi:MAG: winged helix DNA-binding domain-containing protein [Flavisolibacter sp.]